MAKETQSRELQHKVAEGVAAVTSWAETLIALLVLIALIASALPVIGEMIDLWRDGSAVDFHEFLASTLYLVIGIEFIEMLVRHKPGNALEVMLFAIVRHMLVGDGEALENLFCVAAVGLIFLIRKFAFCVSFEEEEPEEEEAEKEKATADPPALP